MKFALGAFIYAALLFSIYHSAIAKMIKGWERPEYNYCYLIPLVILYILWEKRKELAGLPSKPSWLAFIPLSLGMVFFWGGELGGEFFSLYLSLWLVVLGLCWLHLGWAKLRLLAFPFLIALTLFPLPNFLYNKLSVKLQLISSQLGVWVLQVIGFSAYREGNIIDLGFSKLHVVDACSGINSLLSLIVLGLVLAYLFKTALWKRLVILASVIPLAIFMNSLRITSSGVLCHFWGPEAAEGFFHGFSGWLIFMVSTAVLLGEMWILSRIPGSSGESRTESNQSKARSITTFPMDSEKSPYQQLGRFATVLVVLIGSLGLSQGVEFREKVPIRKPLQAFPSEIGEWRGTPQFLESKILESLDLSDYVIMDYRNGDGEVINFYVAYYESQRKGESIHSPETCLPGSGWIFDVTGKEAISLPESNPAIMYVSRAIMQKLGERRLSYFWFPQRGRVLNNAYELKLYAFWDALTKQRTDGALVRLITPMREGESVDSADARLKDFGVLITELLEDYLPGGAAQTR